MVTEFITLQVRVKLTSSQAMTKSERQAALATARRVVTSMSSLSNVNVIPMTAKLVKPPKKAVKKCS